MKRLIYLIALLASFTLLTGFGPLLKGQKVLYRGTVTGLRISAVDGTAFIDGANASITDLANGNNLIEVFDASGSMLRGFLKSQGVTEGLGDELVTGWTQDGSVPYNTLTVNANGHDIDSIINTGADLGRAISNLFMTAGTLYRVVTDITLNSGTSPRLYSWRSGGTQTALTFNITDASYSYTALSTPFVDAGLSIYSINTDVNMSCLFSVKQVLTPSSSGAVIISTKGGAVENWFYKNPSFTYNQAAYTVIVKAAR